GSAGSAGPLGKACVAPGGFLGDPGNDCGGFCWVGATSFWPGTGNGLPGAPGNALPAGKRAAGNAPGAGWPGLIPGAPWAPNIAALWATDGGRATLAAIAPATAPAAIPAATPVPTPAAPVEPGLMTLLLLLMTAVL